MFLSAIPTAVCATHDFVVDLARDARQERLLGFSKDRHENDLWQDVDGDYGELASNQTSWRTWFSSGRWSASWVQEQVSQKNERKMLLH